LPIDFCYYSAAIVTSMVYYAIREAATYQTIVYQLTATPLKNRA